MLVTSVSIVSLPAARSGVVRTKPWRAAVVAVVLGACLMVVGVVLAHRFGALPLPAYGLSLDLETLPLTSTEMGRWRHPVFHLMSARGVIVWLGASLLGLMVPLIVAARQMLLRRRAMPWLMVAVAAPVAIGAVLTVLFVIPTMCIGCCTIS